MQLVCGKCGAIAELDGDSLHDTHRPACGACGGRLRRIGSDDLDDDAPAPAQRHPPTQRLAVEEPEPFDAEGFLWRGREREQKGDLPGALADCAAALDLEPELPSAYLLRAAIYVRADAATAAARDLETFLRLAPDHPQAPRARSKLNELRG